MWYAAARDLQDNCVEHTQVKIEDTPLCGYGMLLQNRITVNITKGAWQMGMILAPAQSRLYTLVQRCLVESICARSHRIASFIIQWKWINTTTFHVRRIICATYCFLSWFVWSPNWLVISILGYDRWKIH